MIKVAIVGSGNIAKGAQEAITATKDMELCGVVSRTQSIESVKKLTAFQGIPVVDDVDALGKIDVAILCSPTRMVYETAIKYIEKGINTVDSFDIHAGILELKNRLDTACKKHSVVSLISAGWDPGSNSVVRALFEAMAPKGISYTNYGPGMSMGHTVAVKAIDGVAEALSITIPKGTGLHRRMVYIKLAKGADFKTVETAIKTDAYFINDETIVTEVESIDDITDKGHGGNIIRKGVSGITQNQRMEYNVTADNPALTAQLMVSCARATMRQQPGAYTMIEIPPVDLLYGDLESNIMRIV